MPTATSTRVARGDLRTVWTSNVWPELDGGRYPVKREVGDRVEVSADILPPILQQGGRPSRCASSWRRPYRPYGIYSGFELCENRAIAGTEEYLHAEKYEIKVRDWDAPGTIKPLVARINDIRRENRGLPEYRNLRFHESDDDSVLFYGKKSSDGGDTILVAVNLDPFEAHQARVRLPLESLGIDAEKRFQVHELLTDQRHLWKGPEQLIRLDPDQEPAAIYRVDRFPHKDYGTPCS